MTVKEYCEKHGIPTGNEAIENKTIEWLIKTVEELLERVNYLESKIV